jgi:hypothetical protein
MKKIIISSIGLVSGLLLAGCDMPKPDSDSEQSQQQEAILKEGTSQIGMPSIVNFRERKLLKQILEMRDQEKFITYSYVFAENTGKFIYVGQSIGYPIPYSTQFTNPSKIAKEWQSGFAILPQADPNGLFSPASAEGTWLVLTDPATNKASVAYFEPKVVTLPYKLPANLVIGY